MKKWLGVAMAAAIALTAGTAGAAEKLKVGFVYVGPIGDHGWTYQHDQGRLDVEKAFGDKVETVYVEKVAEGPDAERAITPACPSRRRADFHHLIRLYGADLERCQKIPQREV